jgi:hypothetical protein
MQEFGPVRYLLSSRTTDNISDGGMPVDLCHTTFRLARRYISKWFDDAFDVAQVNYFGKGSREEAIAVSQIWDLGSSNNHMLN